MADARMELVLPRSILDTDLYKVRVAYLWGEHANLGAPAIHAAGSSAPLSRCALRLSVHASFQRRVLFKKMHRSIQEEYSSCVPWHRTVLRNTQNGVDFASLALTSEERSHLEKHCPYFKPAYLDWLGRYRFKPDQVSINFVPVPEAGPDHGHVEITATGPWIETICWEVPLMACLSETYFLVDQPDVRLLSFLTMRTALTSHVAGVVEL
jgi:nicotinic acid phosphoribosyltransferase